MRLSVESEDEMARLGARFAAVLDTGCVLTLRGPLGAGKTTLVRAILRALGITGSVKSPTYTLVESYTLPGRTVHHFDFYRISDPDEIEYIGIRDLFEGDMVVLIEWPERGEDLLPEADIDIEIRPEDAARDVIVRPKTGKGRELVSRLDDPRSSMS